VCVCVCVCVFSDTKRGLRSFLCVCVMMNDEWWCILDIEYVYSECVVCGVVKKSRLFLRR
jgi:hypothetical protein